MTATTADTSTLAANLKAAYASLDRIPLSAVPRLRAILERGSDECLLIVFRERVRFCWVIAATILKKRGVAVV